MRKGMRKRLLITHFFGRLENIILTYESNINVAQAGLENTTIPIQMWTGLREQLSPTILAVATCLIILSTLILVTAELLRRRSERLRGINR